MNQLKGERPIDRLSCGQLKVNCVGHKLPRICEAIPESNPTILQSSNRPICGNLQIPQQNYLSSALVVFLCQRQAHLGEGEQPMQNCGQVAKSTLSGAPWPISGAQICGWPVSLPASPSASACCPLQSFGICRDNNQQRLCVVSKLGRSSCSPWVRVVSLAPVKPQI